MRCYECEQVAVALCPACLIAQCAVHLERGRTGRRPSSALAGCRHAGVAPWAPARAVDPAEG